jgi:transketolase
LLLTRQKTAFQARSEHAIADAGRGGYVLLDCQGEPEAVILATGSEVGIAMEAAEMLKQSGRRVRVVSMPCMEVFEAQDQDYREAVLPSAIKARVAVEAAASMPWYKYVGLDGKVICMDRFGESAPGGKLFEHFGFTARNVAQAVEQAIKG